MGLKGKLILIATVWFVGLIAFAILAWNTVDQTAINGDQYKRIVLNKDLIADILPPPEYIIEAYFDVLRMTEEKNPETIKEIVAKGKKSLSEYMERHQFWIENLPEGRMRRELLDASYHPAKNFFKIRDEKLIPALLAGDREQARSLARGVMMTEYLKHRRAIDNVVKMAERELEEEEKSAADTLWNGFLALIITGAAVTIIGLLLSLTFIRRIVAQLGGEPEEVIQAAEAVSRGDLALAMDSTRPPGSVYAALRQMVDSLSELVKGVKESAGIVASGAAEISQGNQDLSSRTQNQASAIEETASAIEEMTVSVKRNAASSGEANELANKTAVMAGQGGEVVDRTVTAMLAVTESSKKIGDIINLVNEIAFQTNLLALNAAVEAARAGEAGRGFAVVAGEVRNLAGRSAQAAKEIQALIKDSMTKVEQSNQLAAESGELLGRIITNVQEVADTIGKISEAGQEQARGIDEINKAVSQLDEGVQQNAALVEESASSSESMAAAAEHLNTQMNRFKVRADGYDSGGELSRPAMLTTNRTRAVDAGSQRLAGPTGNPGQRDDFFDSVDDDDFDEI